ncbi:hypothetical protein GYMLUDRAFT_49421 [Collybiopsis luxurians FD-317 M1]|uniref:DUF6534 domain-containing protein n=1 Tax=Collybiopsis luxurians FD-317 M1 TaxID=944289 RepID=A0A0D0BUI7_9AGAR|nr:hypothetical protein GYMLUDRAFT_49421 [Collybiopsis luxurians FD-317 M1]
MSAGDTSPSLTFVRPFYGPDFIGVLLTTALWSIACLQIVIYFSRYPRDSTSLKCLVTLLCVLLNFQVAVLVIAVYQRLVNNFGNPTPASTFSVDINQGNMVPYYLPLLGTIGVCVQSFYIHRLWIFWHKKMLIPIVFAPVGLFEFLAPIVFMAKTVEVGVERGGDYSLAIAFSFPEEKVLLAGLAVFPIVDLVIAGLMWYFLSQAMRDTRFSRTHSLLRRLAILSINTGLWTAIFALLTLILSVALPVTDWYSVSAWPLTALYVNSCLMNLNSRKAQNKSPESVEWNSFGLQDVSGSAASGGPRPFRVSPAGRGPRNMEISISMEASTDHGPGSSDMKFP